MLTVNMVCCGLSECGHWDWTDLQFGSANWDAYVRVKIPKVTLPPA